MLKYKIEKNKYFKNIIFYVLFRLKPLIFIAIFLLLSSIFCLFIGIFEDAVGYKICLYFLLSLIVILIVFIRYYVLLKKKARSIFEKRKTAFIDMAIDINGDFFDIFNLSDKTNSRVLRTSIIKVYLFSDFIILGFDNKRELYLPRNNDIFELLNNNYSKVIRLAAFSKNEFFQKSVGIILMVLSIVSIFFVPFIISRVSDSSFFGVGGFVKWQWLFLFGSIVPTISVFVSLLMRKNGYSCKKNIISGTIVICISIALGISGFYIRKNYDYTNLAVVNAAETIGIYLPENCEVVTEFHADFTYTRAKVTHDSHKFIDSIDLDKWNTTLSSSIRNILPITDGVREVDADYYLFYDCSNNVFNHVEQQEQGNECIFLTYRLDNNKLTILSDYKYCS